MIRSLAPPQKPVKKALFVGFPVVTALLFPPTRITKSAQQPRSLCARDKKISKTKEFLFSRSDFA